jgi:hypothetical protein
MNDVKSRRHARKTTTGECWSLDAGRLAKLSMFAPHGYAGASLTWSNRFGQQTLSVPYRIEDSARGLILHLLVESNERETVDLEILLRNTRPNFGGLRWWFLCPLFDKGVPCNRRVRKLYRPRSVWYFGCRTCQDLTYRSVQEHDKRVDRLVKHFYAIPAALESKDPRKVLLAFKACAKIYKWY